MTSEGLPRPWSRGRATVTVLADGRAFDALVRLDTARETDYYRHGSIMRFMLRGLLRSSPLAWCVTTAA